MIYTRGSGCYGINGADTVSYDAALMSQAVGRPCACSCRARTRWRGKTTARRSSSISASASIATGPSSRGTTRPGRRSRGGRPGHTQPGNIVTGFLAGFAAGRVRAALAGAAAPAAFANGQNAVPSYVTGCVGGACGGTGTVKSERVLSHSVESPFWTGPLRSPNRLQNTFAHECFMDEIAAKVEGRSGRVSSAASARSAADRAVVKAAAKAANWQPRPSPTRRARGRTGRVAQPAAACSLRAVRRRQRLLRDGRRSRRESGHRRGDGEAPRAWRSTRGPISNPDGIRTRPKAARCTGMSRALMEEVTWDDEKVTSVDWRTYHTIPGRLQHPEDRDRVDQHDGRRSLRRGGDVDHRRRARDRERDLRCDRCATAAGAVYAERVKAALG